MKRIAIVAGLALAVVLATVTVFLRSSQAVDDPCYDSCNDAQERIGEMSYQCYTRADAESPIVPDVTFNNNCTEADGGQNGGYSYACSWHWYRFPPSGQ